jgi:hypothetical protein
MRNSGGLFMKDEAHAKPQLKVFDFVGCEIDNN